jgi:hypothetical protein
MEIGEMPTELQGGHSKVTTQKREVVKMGIILK